MARRLAGKGPAVATYIEHYRTTHTSGPSSTDIARALVWPGDHLDHERALEALARHHWITCGDTSGDSETGRHWIKDDQVTQDS